MKILKFLSVLFLFTLITLDGQAKGRECMRVYAFGFSASFNDSTVYFTEIQTIDSAWIDTSSKFLLDRHEYSSQFKNYFTNIGENNRTCVLFYAETEKEIMKKYLSLRKRYENPKKGNPRFRVVNVMRDAFRFVSVKPSYEAEEKPVMTRRELKAARKAAEKAAKAAEKQQVQQVTP